ncbi:MAG TPA: TIM barrel protein [bacterium]|nr:TIM barrel protein [bacterium]
MDRRAFMAACGTVAGGLVLMGESSSHGEAVEGAFSKLPIKISAPLGWFKGGTNEEKLEEVAKWGLPAYEWLGPSGDLDSLRAKADSLGIELSCIVGAGAIAPGHMVQPEQHDQVVAQFQERVKIAKQLNCKQLIGLTGNERDDVSRDQQTEYVIACLKRLAPIAEENDVVLVMETLNPLVDHRGFFLNRTDHAVQIMQAVNSPNVKICFDIYHQQITEGNVIRNIRENIQWIGHFHVADNPGRKEPGTGELNYRNIFKAIAETGYSRFVALECGHSTGNYEDTLRRTLECLSWT